MIARRYRLTKKDDIPALLKEGRMVMGKYLVLRSRPNHGENHRFGIIVSQKISAKAVERNRIRRRIYEITRHHYEDFPKNETFDMLLLPKTAIMSATYADMERDLLQLISKLSSRE